MGFFHALNHGIEEQVIEGVGLATGDILIALPRKEESNPISMNSWYDYSKHSKSSYIETIKFKSVLLLDSTQQFFYCLCHDGNPKF